MEKDPLKPNLIRTGYAFFVQTVGDQIRNKHLDDPVDFSQFLTENYNPPPPKLQKMKLRSHCGGRIITSYEFKEEKSPGDLARPRKPVCAFLHFSAEFYYKIKNENPELSFGGRSKKIAEMWRNLPAEYRQQYNEAAEKSKERYIKEMIDYRKKKGKLPSAPVAQAEEGEEEDEKLIVLMNA